MTRLFLYIFCMSACFTTLAQWNLLGQFDFKTEITAHATDSDQNIYLGFSNGDIIRTDLHGRELSRWSPANSAAISSIQAYTRLKVFSFCRDLQEFHLMERFSAKTTIYKLADFEDAFVTACTFGTDNSLWVLSMAYNELKKINLANNQTILTNPINLDLSTCFNMIPYKNHLIIGNKDTGILIFDWYGNLADQIDFPGLIDLQLSDDNIILLSNQNEIIIYDLMLSSTRNKKAPEGGFQKVGKIGNNFYFILGSQLSIYSTED